MKRVRFRSSIISPKLIKPIPKFNNRRINNRLNINRKVWKPYPYKLFSPEPFLSVKFYKLEKLKLYKWGVEFFSAPTQTQEFDWEIIKYFPTFYMKKNFDIFNIGKNFLLSINNLNKKDLYSLYIQYMLTVRCVHEMNPELFFDNNINYKILPNEVEIPFYIGDNGIVIVKTKYLLQIMPSEVSNKISMLSMICSTIIKPMSFKKDKEETAGNGVVFPGIEFFVDICASKNWFENADSVYGEPYPGLFQIERYNRWKLNDFVVSAPCEIDPIELIYSGLTKYISENNMPEIEFINVETIDHRKLEFNSKKSDASEFKFKKPNKEYSAKNVINKNNYKEFIGNI